MTYYTQESTEVYARNDNKLYDRYQADYDYNGAIDNDGDSADYYRPLYAVRVC
jgi:hypothetical protein